jgi:hypothetical protein
MKYYYVQLADHEVCLQADRFIEDGALEFWLDDDEARKTKMTAMYAAGYWLSAHEIDEKAFNAFTDKLDSEPEGGLQ